jgi:hypothetical protein
MSFRSIVVTTINNPTAPIYSLAKGAIKNNIKLIIIGDTKTPKDYYVEGATFLSIEAQESKFKNFCSVLPKSHYTRKNVGYLEAISNGSICIQETDDDNFPYDSFWNNFESNILCEEFTSVPWANAYALFSDKRIWPRGLPLEYVHQSKPIPTKRGFISKSGLIIQGLADENPDVDAIFRLVLDLPVSFIKRQPIIFQPGSWCPFNSQNTIFSRDVFPLLYLPSMCSFRMTDIWRSFVAQRCMWEVSEGIIFTSSTVWQERNEHNLFNDFKQEIDGYLLNDKIRIELDKLTLNTKDFSINLRKCYESLVKAELLPQDELMILYKWCDEIDRLL